MTAKKQFIKWLLCCLSFAPLWTMAQDNCTQKLRSARNYYQEGKLNLLPDLLTNCIKAGFTKEERIEALRLVTLAHLYSEDEVEAEKVFLELLKINPEFETNEQADPTELILLAERFDTKPKFFYGFKLAGAYSLVEVIEPTKAINIELGPGKYAFSTILGGGLFFQYPINELMSANAEFYFMTRSLKMEKKAVESGAATTQLISEQQSWLELPLLFNYQLVNRPFLLEATVGPAFHYLLNASLSTEGGGGVPLTNVDKYDRRSIFNLSSLVGLRANFKSAGTPFFTLSVLYQHRLLQEVISDGQITQEEKDSAYESNYGDGQFKGHAIWLKAGIRIPYYKPQLK